MCDYQSQKESIAVNPQPEELATNPEPVEDKKDKKKLDPSTTSGGQCVKAVAEENTDGSPAQKAPRKIEEKVSSMVRPIIHPSNA